MVVQEGAECRWASRELDHRVLLGLYLHPEDVESRGRHPYGGARHHGEVEHVVGRGVAQGDVCGLAGRRHRQFPAALKCTRKNELTKNVKAFLCTRKDL